MVVGEGFVSLNVKTYKDEAAERKLKLLSLLNRLQINSGTTLSDNETFLLNEKSVV